MPFSCAWKRASSCFFVGGQLELFGEDSCDEGGDEGGRMVGVGEVGDRAMKEIDLSVSRRLSMLISRVQSGQEESHHTVSGG